MKRRFAYAVLLLTALAVPVEGTDIGKLRPVELVMVQMQNHQVVLRTDTGDIGQGGTAEEAYQNLRDTTSGVVYLDTADYLLISPGAWEEAAKLKAYLDGTVKVCEAENRVEPELAAEYLGAHPPKTRLRDLSTPDSLESLCMVNGRLIINK